MTSKNILILCGGGGTEHEVSLVSANFFQNILEENKEYAIHKVTIEKDSTRTYQDGRKCELRRAGEIVIEGNETIQIDFAIPVIHGPPGESGEIPAVFELMNLPYFGSTHETSTICFNKITTKLWLESLNIPVTPYVYLTEYDEANILKLKDFFKIHKNIFLKASNQGSSVGCYPVGSESNLDSHLKKCFEFSPYVLAETSVVGRELEVSVYEYEGSIQVSDPGEIICPAGFYSYEEKYNNESQTQTLAKAENLSPEIIKKVKDYARRAFIGLKIRHLARIDFFLTSTGSIYLNEPNTFPGHTPISMFPMMLEGNGHNYRTFLDGIISKELNS